MKRHSHKNQRQPGSPQRPLDSLPALAPPARARAPADARDVVALTEHNLASAVDGHPFAIIHFWAPLSVPSRDFAPAFAAAAARNPDILFASVNAQEQRAIVAQFDVRSIPSLMIFRSNIIVFANSGPMTAAGLEEVLVAVRALDMDEVRRKVTSVDAVAVGDASAQAIDGDMQTAEEARLLTLEMYLRPSVREQLAQARPRLASGHLIAIPDAFEPDFAERMHRSLDSCRTWRLHEGYEQDFHFHHHNLYDAEEFPEDLAWCSKVFASPGTRAWVSGLSGRQCPGPTEFSASLYLPGDHSLPHNDVAASDGQFNRQVAYVWHLAKDWQSDWGGALYWCSKGCYLPPAFNTLHLFNVGPESNHFVTRVSPYARGKRIAINGWWTGPAVTAEAGRKAPDRIVADDLEIAVF